jgi:hypothetical protein
MRYSLITGLVAVLLPAALWAEPEPGTRIRILVQESKGLMEVLPTAETEGIVEGDRGCAAASAVEECHPSRRIVAMSRTAPTGKPITIYVDGGGEVASLRAVVNGEQVADREQVQLPAEIVLDPVFQEGAIHVQAGEQHLVVLVQEPENSSGAKVAAAVRAATVSSNIFRFFNRIPEEELWQVIPGSATGGRLIQQPLRCVLPGVPVGSCPWPLIFHGYTDRAQRGDEVLTHVNFAGVAQRLGVIINGRVRGQWTNVALPVLVPQTVSLSPLDDNIYAFAVINGQYVQLRLPVGRRP